MTCAAQRPPVPATVLALALAALLAGCLSPADGTAAPPGGSSPSSPTAAETAGLDERVDLLAGASRDWEFGVAAPDGRSEVLVELASRDGAAWAGGQLCVRFERKGASDGSGSVGQCGAGNVVVSPQTGTAPKVLLHWTGAEVAPGAYHLSAQASPQDAALHVVIRVPA
jgi:hypothetical protein